MTSSFIFSSILLFILECEFIALFFVVIYVGAIAVLFLFSIMMLESKLLYINQNKLLKNNKIYLIFFVFFSSIYLIFIQQFIHRTFDQASWFYISQQIYNNWYYVIDSIVEIEVFGHVLYSSFVLHFLVIGLILLLVLIGICYLTNDKFNQKNLNQSTFKQLSRVSNLF